MPIEPDKSNPKYGSFVVCRRCAGYGWMKLEDPCYRCQGSGADPEPLPQADNAGQSPRR